MAVHRLPRPASARGREAKVLKVRRLMTATADGNFIFKATDPFDEVQPDWGDTIAAAVAHLFGALNIPNAAVTDFNVKEITWSEDATSKQLVPAMRTVDPDSAVASVEEIALIRKGG